MKRLAALLGCALLLVFVSLVTPASAQSGPPGPPGTPGVIINSDCSVTLSFQQAIGATSYSVIAAYNGNPLGTFPIGTLVTVRTPVLPAGNWSFQIIAINSAGQTLGGPNNFIHSFGGAPPPGGAPGVPTWVSVGTVGSTVNLSWLAGAGATGYDIEAIIQATGQVISLPVGPQTTMSVPGVPAGNFLVRIRSRNAFGVSAYTGYRQVVVGTTLGVGDLQVTLTWNSTVDMDLHVIEPNGAHVYYANRTGTTARLDVDDTNGFGPENIFVGRGAGAPGVYTIYIVHYSGGVPTTSTIGVTLNPGTANAQFTLFTRQSTSGNPGLGFNVATVNMASGTITEVTGTRDERENDERPKATEAAAAGGSR